MAWAADGATNVKPINLGYKLNEVSWESEPRKEVPIWELVKNKHPKKIYLNKHIDQITETANTIDEIKTDGEWEVIPVKLDSGAVDWVFKKETAQAFGIQETESSKNGINYAAANGTPIANYGQRLIKGFTDEFQPLELAAQVAEVRSNLAAAVKIVGAGNRIVLDEDGSYIQDKKLRKTH